MAKKDIPGQITEKELAQLPEKLRNQIMSAMEEQHPKLEPKDIGASISAAIKPGNISSSNLEKITQPGVESEKRSAKGSSKTLEDSIKKSADNSVKLVSLTQQLVKNSQKNHEDMMKLLGRILEANEAFKTELEEAKRGHNEAKSAMTAEYGPASKTGSGKNGETSGGGFNPLDLLGGGGKGKTTAGSDKMSRLGGAATMGKGLLKGALGAGIGYGLYNLLDEGTRSKLGEYGISEDVAGAAGGLIGGAKDLYKGAKGLFGVGGEAAEGAGAAKAAGEVTPKGYKAAELAAEYGTTAEKAAAGAAEGGGFLSKAKGVLGKGVGLVGEYGGKLLSKAAVPLTVAAEGYQSYTEAQDVNERLKRGEITEDEADILKAKAFGGGLGAVGGSLAGATAGGVLGTAVAPGVGTVAGGVTGGIAGGELGRKAIGGLFEGGARAYIGARNWFGGVKKDVGEAYDTAKGKITGVAGKIEDAYNRGTGGTLDYQESYKNAREEWRQLGGEDSDTEGFNKFYDEKQKQFNKTGANRMATTSLASQSKLEQNANDGNVSEKISKGITSEKSLLGSTLLGSLFSREGLHTGSFTGTSMENKSGKEGSSSKLKELTGIRTSGGLFGADKYEVFDGKDFITVDKSTYMKMKDQVESNNIEEAGKTLENFKKMMAVSQEQSGMTVAGDMGAVGNATPTPKQIEPEVQAQNQAPIIIKGGDTNVTNNNTSGSNSGGAVGTPSRIPNPFDRMVFGDPWAAYP